MASFLLKPHIQTTKFPYSPLTFSNSKIQFHSLLFFPNYPKSHPSLETFLPRKHFNIPKHPQLFFIHSSLSNSSSPSPPTSKEDAILQAKTSLSTALQKPLNNPKLTGRIKKQKHPRFRVEIPLIDDSPDSLTQLAFDVFGDLQIKRKGSPVKLLLIWPNPTTSASGQKAFQALTFGVVEHIELTNVMTVDNRILNSADVAVFLAPNSSQLTVMKSVSDSLYPSPLVLFNPKWAFEEEGNFGELSGFVGSFDVIYAFLGLEVRGILSKRKGVVFKWVRDGLVSGEKWNVLVEDEGKTDQLKVVSRFKSRPSITEVENVLYNLMAVNSPITKSAKFFKDLVSNVTGKKTS
ncbi:Low-density lipoprotein receptor-related protein [Bienertia sinuspersici]